MGSRSRLAVVLTHPIQYLGPLFRKLAQHPEVDLTVLFCCDHGQKPTLDRDFNSVFAWDVPVASGYSHEFVSSIHPHPSPYGFWSLTNPGLWTRLTPVRFDAVMVVGWAIASHWLALGAARAHGLPVLLRAESGLDSWQPRASWKQLARRGVLGAFFAGVDAFVAVGSDNAALYRQHGIPDERIFVSPYAVDNEFFARQAAEAAPRRRALRAKLGVEDDRPIVVTSGKLIDRKAPLDLLRAFAKVRRNRRATLVFMGDGPLRGEVERASRAEGVADDVVITGFRQQGELGEVYAAADVFVFPTRFETWGLVLNEAMISGLPVICTDRVSAHRDLVEAGVTGDVYPAGDVDALTSVLERRLADPERMKAMGRSARARVEKWGLDEAADGIARALRFAVDRRGFR